MDAQAMLAQAERVDGCASRLHHAGHDAAALSLSTAADKIRRRANELADEEPCPTCRHCGEETPFGAGQGICPACNGFN